MATKTISIELDVYERLKSLREGPSESFSQVLRRTLPKGKGLTAADLLARLREDPSPLGMSEEELQSVAAVREETRKYDDPWNS